MFDWLHTAVHGAVHQWIHEETAHDPPNLGWSGCVAEGAKAFRFGRYEEAERRYRDAIRAACSSGPLESLIQGSRVDVTGLDQGLYHLGVLYDFQERYADAEDIWRRLLEVRKERCGANHPLTANCHANLASACQYQNKLAEAMQHAKRALSIHAAAEPSTPEYVAFAYQVLGSICADLKDWNEAEIAFKRCLALRSDALPPAHPDLVRTRATYATVLEKLGRSGEAAQLWVELKQFQVESDERAADDSRRRLVLQAGTPVAAAVVVADPQLFKAGAGDGSALVLFSFASNIPRLEDFLEQLSERLARLKDGVPRSADERRLAAWLRDPKFIARRRRQIPFALTQDRWVYLADLWVRRRDLPDGYLVTRLLRCAAEQSDAGGIELLPPAQSAAQVTTVF
jgi:tetratricopeptide (TPR) repeat protein